MFVVANRVPVAAGWEETFEQRFKQRAGQIDKQSGFVRMQILKPTRNDSPYVVLTTGRTRLHSRHGWAVMILNWRIAIPCRRKRLTARARWKCMM